jgi:hypothetical protein
MKQLEISKALIYSAGLHIILFWVLINQQIIIPNNITYTVELVPELFQQTPNKKQFVSPTLNTPKIPVPDTNLKSDHDSAVEKQQIKKGDPDAGIPGQSTASKQSSNQNLKEAPVSKKQMPSQAQEKKQVVTTPKVLNQARNIPKQINKKLDLSPATQLLNQVQNQEITKKPESQNTADSPTPFSRSSGTGAKFYGFSGASDFLPNISDGDLTLLNAKADKFSVFVRRVAVRIFQILKQSGWERLSANEVRSIRDWSYVKASMNLKGELLNVTLHGTSGSIHFDGVLKDAVTRGMPDPHPPKEAIADDGNIRFIFLAKSWSMSSTGNQGGLLERRWLMLKTGLE